MHGIDRGVILPPDRSGHRRVIFLNPTGWVIADTLHLKLALRRAKRMPEQETLEIRFAPGIFRICRCLYVYSNTHLILDENTVMLRAHEHLNLLRSARNRRLGGYDQAHDIMIEGGVWDGGARDPVHYRRLMIFGHARNITFAHATVTNVTGKHVVCLAGVDTARIEDVRFTGFIGLKQSEQKRRNAEMLHIDAISGDGISEPGSVRSMTRPAAISPSRTASSRAACAGSEATTGSTGEWETGSQCAAAPSKTSHTPV